MGDAVAEPDETFSVDLSNASNATIGDSQAIGTIANDDVTDYQPSFPIRANFYYQWFPEGWTQNSIFPYAKYRPSLGFYDSGDSATIRAHVRSMLYGTFQATIASWWGQNQKSEQTRVPALLAGAAAVDPNFRVTLYYEKEGSGKPHRESDQGRPRVHPQQVRREPQLPTGQWAAGALRLQRRRHDLLGGRPLEGGRRHHQTSTSS
jgi:hypothetical protein